MNANLWVLLSETEFPHEQVIRGLTGAADEGYFDLMLASGLSMHMWTQVNPVNEGADAPAPQAWAQSWVDYMKEWGPQLRYNGLAGFRMTPGNPQNTPQAYIEAFALAGGRIESIITLGKPTPEWVRSMGVPFADIGDMPWNAIAALVRGLWGWR